jgi:putative PIN family toxin of toxin-antitoxin system
MRIVLDTNILIAAFITEGVCHLLLEHCVRQHDLITSSFILDELHEKLTGKFRYSKTEAEAVIDLLRTQMVIVAPIKLESVVSRDPDDDTILGTAVAGNADCIVTGDKDLLVIKQFEKIDIVHPSDFAGYEVGRQTN